MADELNFSLFFHPSLIIIFRIKKKNKKRVLILLSLPGQFSDSTGHPSVPYQTPLAFLYLNCSRLFRTN